MMGMSFEDTLELVCSKSGNLLQKESVASVVKKKLPATQCHLKSNGCVCCKGWWQFRAFLEMRIRMTHWPTPVSSLNIALLQNESSNPTSDGSQLRSSHNLKAALRSPSLCINTALLLGVMPTQVFHVCSKSGNLLQKESVLSQYCSSSERIF